MRKTMSEANMASYAIFCYFRMFNNEKFTFI